MNSTPENESLLKRVQALIKRWVAIRFCVKGVFCLIAGLAVVLLYLHLMGFPRWISDPVMRELNRRGLNVQWEELHFDIRYGLLVREVKWFASSVDSTPLFCAEKMVLDFKLQDLLHAGFRLNGIRIINGRYCVAEDGESAQALSAVSELQAEIRFMRSGTRIERFSGKWIGIHLYGNGIILKPDSRYSGSPFAVWEKLFAQPLTDESEMQKHLLELLQSMQSKEPPVLEVEFTVHPVQLDLNECTIELHGESVLLGNVHYDELKLDAAIKNGTVVLPSLLLKEESGSEARLSGSYRIQDQTIAVRLSSSLGQSSVVNLLPSSWVAPLFPKKINFIDGLEFSVTAGPAAVSDIASTVKSSIQWSSGVLDGVYTSNGYIQQAMLGPEELKSVFYADVGRSDLKGRVGATGIYRFASGAYEVDVTARCDPLDLKGWMGRGLARFIDQTEFTERGLSGQLRVIGSVKQKDSMAFEGFLSANDVMLRGAAWDSVQCNMAYSNWIVRLTDVEAIRPEGRLRGTYEQDFERETVTFDARSSVYPFAIGKLMGAGVQPVFDVVSCTGRVFATGSGFVDYARCTNMDFNAHVTGTLWNVQGVDVELASFHLKGVRDRYELKDLVAQVHQGRVHGNAAAYPLGVASNLYYDLAVIGTNINVQTLAGNLRGKEGDEYTGRLSFETTLMGGFQRPMTDSLQGAGSMRIAGGQLFRIPLLGGLSKYLANIIPGFGYAAQTDFSSKLKIEDRTVYADDLQIEGNIISLRGSGNLDFDKRLDFDMRVFLLKRGPLAKILNVVTYPVTRLFLEFHLGGKIHDPAWRPVNLPKEMYLIFD